MMCQQQALQSPQTELMEQQKRKRLISRIPMSTLMPSNLRVLWSVCAFWYQRRKPTGLLLEQKLHVHLEGRWLRGRLGSVCHVRSKRRVEEKGCQPGSPILPSLYGELHAMATRVNTVAFAEAMKHKLCPSVEGNRVTTFTLFEKYCPFHMPLPEKKAGESGKRQAERGGGERIEVIF